MALEIRQHPDRRRPTPRLALAIALGTLAAGTLIGCQGGPIAAWRMAHDDSLSKGPTPQELGDDRSLLARLFNPQAPPSTDPTANTSLVQGPKGLQPIKPEVNPEADAELAAAGELLKQGKADEAERAYRKIAEKRKGKLWGEKARWCLAESKYQRGKLVAAHDAYEKLIAEYPNSTYLDKAIGREYAIGLKWLAQYDPKTKPEELLPWQGRFDGSGPLFDTVGDGLAAARTRALHHDPDGPLADDAVLKIADQHMADGDFESAATFYDQLITEHPKSPYFQRAQLASIDARMKGYLGPKYDGSGLEKARERIKQTLTTFPDRPAEFEKLYHTLDLINDAEAERAYEQGAFYRRTNKIASAEYMFGKIPQRWPKSTWAAKAKEQLTTLAKMDRTETLPSKLLSSPALRDPFSNTNGPGSQGPMGGGMGGGMGGMGMGGMGMGGMGGPGGMM